MLLSYCLILLKNTVQTYSVIHLFALISQFSITFYISFNLTSFSSKAVWDKRARHYPYSEMRPCLFVATQYTVYRVYFRVELFWDVLRNSFLGFGFVDLK